MQTVNIYSKTKHIEFKYICWGKINNTEELNLNLPMDTKTSAGVVAADRDTTPDIMSYLNAKAYTAG